MSVDESLLQILAAADIGDEEDMAIRAALFVTLRDLGAGNGAVTRPDTRSLRTRSRRDHRRAGPTTRNFPAVRGSRRADSVHETPTSGLSLSSVIGSSSAQPARNGSASLIAALGDAALDDSDAITQVAETSTD